MTSSATLTKAPSLEEQMQVLRRRVDEALGRYLPLVGDGSCPDRLAGALGYSLLGGGKRLRPVLCLMAAEACGAPVEKAMPAACALELVHTYSLVHDDLPAMDDDDLRRGRPTCHRAYDEATAILCGDGLLTLAFEVLARGIEPASAAVECVAILADASGPLGMVGGQMLDLESEGRWDEPRALGAARRAVAESQTATLEALEAIHRKKTGALLRASLRMGAVVAAAPAEWTDALDRYGQAVGLAFQIVDDLLDVLGDEAKMGKRVRKDRELGKWTYPRFLGVEGSRRRAQALAEEASAALAPLGERGERLRNLATALVERDR